MKTVGKAKSVVKKSAMESRGRKRDLSLDNEILNAAIEILANVGYEKMTLIMVAKK